jgi:hypothetical protein
MQVHLSGENINKLVGLREKSSHYASDQDRNQLAEHLIEFARARALCPSMQCFQHCRAKTRRFLEKAHVAPGIISIGIQTALTNIFY